MVDVTVYGAGVFGLSIAFTLAKRGIRVRIVDPDGPGAGASGGILGALAPHTPENWNPKKEFQFQSLCMAERFWSDVRKLSGQNPLFRKSGRVQPLPLEAEALARVRADSAQSLWRGAAVWRVVKGAHWGLESDLWVHDTLSAQIHPRSAVDALAQACVALGCEIVPDGPDEGTVVIATGVAGLRALSEEFGKTVGVPVKGQAALFGVDMGALPQLFVDGMHVLSHGNGTVAIGSTTERDATGLETDDQLEALIKKARDLVPALADAPVVQRWAGFRPRAKSRAPILGIHPKRKNTVVANGGFKIGFGMAPMVGEVIANLLVDNIDDIPEGFRVEDNL